MQNLRPAAARFAPEQPRRSLVRVLPDLKK
jgi:hypothetical protein